MRILWIGMMMLVGAGCGEVQGSAHRGSARGCAKGQIQGYSGACMPVGIPIQACAPMFIEGDGLCHPRMEKCAKGTIPKFDAGCVPVGITKCAAVFMGDDGLCRPSVAKCMSQPNTFPVPEEGCVPIDGPDGCGAGPWGKIPDAAVNVYVDPSAAAGGTGSKDKPVRTIAAAISLAADGGRIALAAGTYEEPALLSKSIEVVGVCPSKVKIHGAASLDSVPAIAGAATPVKVSLRDLTLSGAGVGVLAHGGAQVSASRVHIQAATSLGANAMGAGSRLTFDHCLIEDTIAGPQGTEETGRGIEVEDGGSVAVVKSAIVRNSEAGVVVFSSSSEATVEGSLIEGTLERNDEFGHGVTAQEGAKVTLKESALVGNHNYSVFVTGAGSQIAASSSLIGGTLPKEPSRMNGAGVAIRHGAHGIFEGNAIVDNTWGGINVEFDNATLTSTGDLIANTRAEIADGESGSGIDLYEGVQATVTSSALVGNQSAGLHAQDPGTRATVTSTLLQGTLPRPADGYFGFGAEVVGGAALTVTGSAVVGNHSAGLTGAEAGSQLSVDTTLVEDTLSVQRDTEFGRGIEVDAMSKFSLDASVVSKNKDAGVVVFATSDASVTRSLIQETAPRQADGMDGFGVLCHGSKLTLGDTVVRDSSAVGVLVTTLSSAAISRVQVGGVRVARTFLLDSTEVVSEVGDGILINAQSSAVLSDVLVSGAARAGILFGSSQGNISNSHVASSQFGLVLDGSPKPSLGRGNAFSGTKQANVIDGNLPLPDAPPAIR